jgi:sugar lactone lactonase YvrE
MPAFLSILLFSLAFVQALCFPQSFNIREVYRFPNGTWLENIAVRLNGNLLVTDLMTVGLWEIVPPTESIHSSIRLVHHFDGADDVAGITEVSPDTFAVISSNSVWQIEFNSHDDPPKATLISKIPAGFLNGMATLDEGKAVMISDSQLGLVWHLDIQTGNYTVLHRHETMEANSDLGLLIGVNGLRILHNYMYYTNSPKRIFCRVRIDTRTGRALGPYEIVSHDTLADDFAIDPRGIGYLASLTDNEITRVFPNGSHDVVAGSKDSRDLMAATSAAFGRTRSERHVLYVTTGGETENPVNNTASLGGKVMAVSIPF